MDNVRLAIVGLGQGMEHFYASCRLPYVEVVAVVERNSEHEELENMRKKGIEVFHDVSDLKKEKEDGNIHLDGIILALPHHVYEGILDDIFSMNIPVLKEKPLAKNLHEAINFLDKSQQYGVTLYTAIQRRLHEGYVKFKELLGDYDFERVHLEYRLGFKETSDKSWRDDYSRTGGGMLLDAGYHMLDIVQFLFGTPTLVSASMSCSENGQDVPTDKVGLEQKSHLIMTRGKAWISVECLLRPYEWKGEQVLVDTEKGLLKFQRTKPLDSPEDYTETITLDNSEIYTGSGSWDSAYEEQISTFVKRIKKKEAKFGSDTAAQLSTMKILEDAYNKNSLYAPPQGLHESNSGGGN